MQVKFHHLYALANEAHQKDARDCAERWCKAWLCWQLNNRERIESSSKVKVTKLVTNHGKLTFEAETNSGQTCKARALCTMASLVKCARY